jgi:hydrogenase-4 component F
MTSLTPRSEVPSNMVPVAGPLAPWVMVVSAVLAASVAAVLAWRGPAASITILEGYVRVDATARLFVLLVNMVFVGVAVYVWSRVQSVLALREGIGRFVALVLIFMAAANAAILANHFLVGWLLLEVTTFAAAPMIIRRSQSATLPASWRYFLFSSVGLALTLAGFACIVRGFQVAGVPPTLFIDQVDARAGAGVWQSIGVSLILLGYGTKLGLAPMHTWLPETYDEAPPAVTALLGAVQFNCALVGLMRVLQVFRETNASLITTQLISVGLLSMAVSSVSIIVTRNYKRLIAYASINHAGVIAIGLGVGHEAMYGLVLYLVSNAFIKAMLFLTVGKIKARYRTKDMREISGLIRDMPQSGLFMMIGTFALLGLPPFGSFLGELLILSGLVRTGQPLVVAGFCVLLTVTFVATGRSLFPMIWGPSTRTATWPRPTRASSVSMMLFFAALVAMGLYMPAPLSALFRQVAISLGGA